MDRREMLGVLGASAVGLAAVPGQGARADHHTHTHMDKMHEDCFKACADCAKACDMAFHHCVDQVAQGKKEHAKSVQLTSDCAGFCSLAACTIAKSSPLMVHACAACADACKITTAEVGNFDDDLMKKTAQLLRACEKSCREMVKSMGGHHAAAPGQ